MRAESYEEHATYVAIVVLAIHLPDIAVPVGAHKDVKLLPDGIHLLKIPTKGKMRLGLVV